MKKYKLIVLVVLIGILISGCIKVEHGKSFYNLKHVAPYLYEVTFDDYKWDEDLETVTNVDDFGCSSVKNGNFYGRNFDFVYNDIPEFIIKVKANENRHSSIGVGYVSEVHEEENIKEKYSDRINLLPNATMDGINDAGVICSDNVVPKNDTVPITGTNPEGEKLHISLIVRYVLDNASSADDAIKLLEERNIYGDLGEEYNLHFMIADKDKTYIVEFIDNKMVAKLKTGNEQIMTNYYVNLDYYTEHSAGIERYNILKENYEESSSFEGMWNLLQRVRYTNAYTYYKVSEWYSEFLTQSQIELLNDDSFRTEAKANFDNIKNNYWMNIGQNNRKQPDISYWITTHNSTYDIENRKLRVTVQEDYNIFYEYKLD